MPELKGKLFVGIKYGHDGENVAMSVAVKTKEGKIFVESIDCRPTRAGNRWILENLAAMDYKTDCIDGANGSSCLQTK